MFGNDPNWGRVLAAVGTVPGDVAAYDPGRARRLDQRRPGVPRRGATSLGTRSTWRRRVRCTSIVDLHAGGAAATVWTNDLTHDYVHENSAYST